MDVRGHRRCRAVTAAPALHQRRGKVAVITFRGKARRCGRAATSSTSIAETAALAGFDTGGKTPLAQN